MKEDSFHIICGDVGDVEALLVGREADPAGRHVPGELFQSEGRTSQQAGDRGERVAGIAPQSSHHFQERKGKGSGKPNVDE